MSAPVGTLGPIADSTLLDRRAPERESVPARLFSRGNRLFWHAEDLDLAEDRRQWDAAPDYFREALLHQVAMFLAGEEAVASDVLPLMTSMVRCERHEDARYLSQFAFEESKHADAFSRWVQAIGVTTDLRTYVEGNPAYRSIVHRALPEAMGRLERENTPRNQVIASATYNLVVEGILAFTGYYAVEGICSTRNLFPGLRLLLTRTKSDERRHLAWGTYFCRDHVARDPECWPAVQGVLDDLAPLALDTFDAVFSDLGGTPFKFLRRPTRHHVQKLIRTRREAIARATRTVGR